MARHLVKLWPIFYDPIANGELTGCLRKDDRGFKVGDGLVMQEFLPTIKQFTKRFIEARITFIIRHQDLPDVPEGYCILSLKVEYKYGGDYT